MEGRRRKGVRGGTELEEVNGRERLEWKIKAFLRLFCFFFVVFFCFYEPSLLCKVAASRTEEEAASDVQYRAGVN